MRSDTSLRPQQQENPAKVLTYAHFYLIDHLISTLYIVFFGVTWYVYTPHDGRRIANSAAQKEILEGSGPASSMSEEERTRMALQVWNDEKSFSTTVIILGWLVKVCVYADAARTDRCDLQVFGYSPALQCPFRFTSLQSCIRMQSTSAEGRSVPCSRLNKAKQRRRTHRQRVGLQHHLAMAMRTPTSETQV